MLIKLVKFKAKHEKFKTRRNFQETKIEEKRIFCGNQLDL